MPPRRSGPVLCRSCTRHACHRRRGQVDARVAAWVAEDGRRRRQDDEPKPKGLRQMLASLPVIWPGARAEDFPALLLDAKAFDTAALKKHYLKAVRCARHSQFELQAHGALAIWEGTEADLHCHGVFRLVHPDRVLSADVETSAVAALLFGHLADANERYRKKHTHSSR
jgi:hypothetical protein